MSETVQNKNNNQCLISEVKRIKRAKLQDNYSSQEENNTS